jgi:amino acid adenylation domain-containing protein
MDEAVNQKTYLSKENVESIRELSLLQEKILQQSAAGQNQGNHILNIAFNLKGPVEIGKIRSTWQEIIRQTPLLRTVFRTARGRTVQVVLKEYPAALEIIDQRDKPMGEPSSAISLCNHTAFNLTEETGVHFKLIRKANDRSIFLLSCHRIIMDQSGLLSVFQDFMSIYGSLLKGENIPALHRTPFNHYLDWQAQQYWLPALNHWQKELAAFESPTSLLGHQRLNKTGNHRCSLQQLLLSEEESESLEKASPRYGVSPAVIVQTAWALLLHLYSREPHVYFGVGLQGPPGDVEEFRTVIGPFENILPLHVIINETQTLRELVMTIGEKNEHLRRYSYIPREEIRSHLNLPEDVRLFESSISLKSHPGNPLETHGTLQLEKIEFWQYRDHPIAIEIVTGKRWQLRFFCPGEGTADTVMLQVLKSLAVILTGIARNPAARVSQLDYLSAEDLEQFNALNKSAIQLAPFDPERLMQEVFAEQVEESPHAIASTCENLQVSYRELNCRANRLAHWLKGQGIGPNQLVGIFCQRSIEMLTAVLAIFKAGAAYIPLDPGSPARRLQTILLDGRMKVIFTSTPGLERTIELIKGLPSGLQVFCLDPLGEAGDIPNTTLLKEYSPDNPPIINSPRDIAYVIFTSGSTGVPKGAVVEHMGMINHLYTKIRLLQISSLSKVAQNASHCFDISVWQLLSALMMGGQTVIYSNEVAMSPGMFRKALKSDRVTIVEMVPAVMELMLQEKGNNADTSETRLPDIRYLLSTGEALPAALCRKWLEEYPHIPVINAYGPTECSDDTHHRVVSTADELEDDYIEVPLGRVIPNFRAYILDKTMHLLPPGCPGEICLTGIGVGRGYLNNPGLTKETFVNNPLSDGMGTRMYRTGDLGYFDSRGELVFLGRLDSQIKVRGFRIELGEIETQLRKHPAVKQCVAVIRGESPDQTRILSYVILREQVSIQGLRTFLETSLPYYMIPDHIMELDQLPLNRSGKIDRKALPDPERTVQSLDPGELPQTPLEKKLAHIWEEVLEISPIGRNFNFFQLGGHSLKVIQVRSRIAQQFGVDISIIDLFQKQIFHQQAALIEEQRDKADAVLKKTIPKLPKAPYYPMSQAQQRLFFLHQMDPQNTSYNLPTALRFQEDLDVEKFKNALQTVVQRQASLRTTFAMMENKPVQLVAENIALETWFKIEDFSQMQEVEQTRFLAQRMEQEAHFPFDLTKAPLFYAIIFKLVPRDYILFFNMHHIIGDLWSWEIFFKELISSYQSGIEEKEASLPALPIQYADYAVWQNQCIENGDFQKHEDYWLNQFTGEIPVLELPLDFSHPIIQKYSGGTVSRKILQTCLDPLINFFREKNVTLFIGLLALFYAFLYKITGQEDIIIGTPEAGRNQVELENLMGFFINTIPLRVNLTGDPTFSDLLDRVKQVSLEAYEHAEYPLNLIINKINPERNLIHYPLFSVMFQVLEEAGGSEKSDSKSSMDSLSTNVNIYDVPLYSTNYDLDVIFIQDSEGLRCTFFYRKDLFKEETIQRWLDHLIVFLEGIVISPGRRISAVSLLTEKEKHQLLNDWNMPPVDYPRTQTLHSLFENQVERTPDYIAIVETIHESPSQQLPLQLTYQRLNKQSTQLAHTLREIGVLADSIVAITAEPSIEMIVGILGILKAGSAYLLIDPDYPEERIKYILTDSSARILVVKGSKVRGVSERIELIDLNQLTHLTTQSLPNTSIQRLNHSLHFTQPGPSNLAYIIYTSGTTGKPKGTMIEHRNIVNLMKNDKFQFDFNPTDVWTLFHSFCFDFSVWEMYGALLNGGKLLVISKITARDTARFLKILKEQGITVLNQTPSAFYSLMKLELEGTDIDHCSSIRYIIFGGEALSPKRLKPWKYKYPSTKLINMYGITETCVHVTYKEIGEREIEKVISNIGKAIPNWTIYVMDKNLSLLPPGIPGELCVGGGGIARGYLNQPTLTREKFVENPYKPKEKLYRSGDLAKWSSRGELEYLGRIDHQVKIRGYRIEPGGIENLLVKKDNIKEAVVMVKKNNQNEKYLCAYIVFNHTAGDPGTLRVDDLKDFLLRELPVYMIPNQFVKIDAIPLTPSGKIDRKALMTMGEKINAGKEFQPPRSGMERIIAETWKEVLEIEQVSINHDFFEIGGDSLSAMRLISKLNERGIMIAINQFFQYPTIKELAQYIKNTNKESEPLIETFEEAEVIFEKEFRAKGEFVTFYIEQKNYHVFYTEDSLLQTEYARIVDFFRIKLSLQLFPHYIKSISQKPAANKREMVLSNMEFSKILRLKIDEPDLEKHFIESLKKELSQLGETILENKTKTIKQYQLSPIQKVHLTLANTIAYSLITFEQPIDTRLLEESFLELIKEQGLLRSILVKKDGQLIWNELIAPERIQIPYIDLIEYDNKVKDKVIDEISLHKIMKYHQVENTFLYKPLLFRKDLKTYWLMSTFSTWFLTT